MAVSAAAGELAPWTSRPDGLKLRAMQSSNEFPPARAVLTPPTDEQVAALAHALWIDRGQPEGRDLEHWFEAERQLRIALRPRNVVRHHGPDTER